MIYTATLVATIASSFVSQARVELCFLHSITKLGNISIIYVE